MRLSIALAAVALAGVARAQDYGPTDGGTEAPPPLAAPQALPAPPVEALPETPALRLHDAQLRAQILHQADQETDAKLHKMKDELRDEMRAEMVTAGSAPSEFEQLPAEKPKLQLLELNGYFRLRPNLYQNLQLGWTAPDPMGYYLFPNPNVNTTGRTVEDADMRFRVEPTLNVSEDIRIRSQIDIFDNTVLGSSPLGGGWFDLGAGAPSTQWGSTASALSPGQGPLPIEAKRAWAEVTLPVGELRFGRMGNNWGLGMWQNDGNCLDCDYGNTVDRAMFIGKLANHYIMPMIDFVGSGPLYNLYANDPLGQPVAYDRALGAYEYVLAVARKDTDEELRHAFEQGRSSFNYGVYAAYRSTDHAYLGPAGTLTQPQIQAIGSNAIVEQNANYFTPDLWLRYETKRLRLELEATLVYGGFDVTDSLGNAHPISVDELGSAFEGEYHLLADGALTLGLYGGVASGDPTPGFGNQPNRQTPGNGPTPPGSIDGPQFYCRPGIAPCANGALTNFSFNPDYHVDMILWREILGGVTDAWYAKPVIKYTLTEGLDVSVSAIYSQALFYASTPGGHVPLGLEADGGIHYMTDDGFFASLDFGILFPFAGLGELDLNGNFVYPSSAQALRIMLGVRY